MKVIRDVANYVVFQVRFLVAWSRERLADLYRHPWFPRRKVLAAGLTSVVSGFLTLKLGLDIGPEFEGAIVGASGLFIGWLIPEPADS